MTFSWRLADVSADHVLAVYGTLRPGQSNFEIVAPIGGTWLSGTIRGTLGRHPLGRYEGYPAFRRGPEGDEVAVDVPVDVLVSSELVDHWERLDAFEGPGYRRVTVEVTLDSASEGDGERADGGSLVASVYESWPEGDTP